MGGGLRTRKKTSVIVHMYVENKKVRKCVDGFTFFLFEETSV